jgi:hypothetical protein
MLSLREALRVGAVLTLGGFCGAVVLAVLLIVFANVESAQPIFTDISLGRIFWSSWLFCFFTLPVAWFFGAPGYWLLRRFNLLRVWVCSVRWGHHWRWVGGYGWLLL